jgi:hypothetical protein
VFSGGGFGVGLTVADLAPPSPEFGPPVTSVPPLGELFPVHARSPEEKAAELQRVDRMEAALAATSWSWSPGSPPTARPRETSSRVTPVPPRPRTIRPWRVGASSSPTSWR